MAGAALLAVPGPAATPARLDIPRLDGPLDLSQQLEMRRGADAAGGLARVLGFVQRDPRDGEPARVETEVYAAYDDDRLHFVFLAWDERPASVRARLTRREDFDGDDWVEVRLDTFDDRRRAFTFRCNPRGVQLDGLFTEGQGLDVSWDTVWRSEGQVTERGYAVWMSIPFRSLRFPARDVQRWGVVLSRFKPEINETSYWPRVSRSVDSVLEQSAPLEGLRGISPGRNLQAVPYVSSRSFRVLDERAPGGPAFVEDPLEAAAGLDAKLVLRDSLAVDATVNPDFSQVESDLPQVTTNRRFEVFFPERRPFFLENAGFFQTPINLVFTRRIADPRLGGRVTGKLGGWAVGALMVDDEAPGLGRAPEDPVSGERARFGIARVSRDLPGGSTVGGLYTERRFAGGSNRVGSLDGRFRLGDLWTGELQGARSVSESPLAARLEGSAVRARLARYGRRFELDATWLDVSPDFRTETGFLTRTDQREATLFTSWAVRPEGELLTYWQPLWLIARATWDHQGVRLDREIDPWLTFQLADGSFVWLRYNDQQLTLRPQDAPGLSAARDYSLVRRGVWIDFRRFARLTVSGFVQAGDGINFVPAAGSAPEPGDAFDGRLELTLRPIPPLRLEASLIASRLTDPADRRRIFDERIARAAAYWQLTRRLSLRAILRYDRLEADPAKTLLEPRRGLNADLLLTWRSNPWTALFVGYNDDRRDVELVEGPSGARLLPDRGRLTGDARQLFVKLSYLFRW